MRLKELRSHQNIYKDAKFSVLNLAIDIHLSITIVERFDLEAALSSSVTSKP